MKAKEKAKELVDKYLDLENYNNLNLDLFCDECGMSNEAAKQCALIAVDEIINQYNSGRFDYKTMPQSEVEYWQEVKQELEKL
jgi:homoaconitase/3-isopropylmalate dehydratase large subunit